MEYQSITDFKLNQQPKPICGGVPNAIILAPSYDTKILAYMQENYDRVFSIMMYNLEVPCYFLPMSFTKGHLLDCFTYNFPQINLADINFSGVIDRFNTILSEKNNIQIGDGGIAIMDFNDPTLVLDYYPIDISRKIPDQLNEWTTYFRKKNGSH